MAKRENHDTTNVYSFRGMFKGACIFSSPETLYYVRKFHMKDTNRVVTVTGYLKTVAPNIPYIIKGKWSYVPKYDQWQIRVEDYEKDESTLTKKETINYLSSELFTGIGPTIAGRVFERFGDQSIAIAENEPERLIEVKGITQRKVDIIKESFQQNKYLKYIINELGTKGVSFSLCQKIYLEYEDKSIDVIKEKPYSLAYDIPGIGFKKADSIALTYNSIKYHDIERVKAGIFFAVKSTCESKGHTYVEFHDIEKEVKNLLNTVPGDYITFKEINDALVSLCEDKKLVIREGQCYLMSLYKAEQDSVKHTVDILKAKSAFNFDIDEVTEAIDRYEKKKNVSLAPDQKKGIIKALTHSFSILTGGPGTGKSFTISAIVSIFKELYNKKYGNEFFVQQFRPDYDEPIKEGSDEGTPIYRVNQLVETCAPTGKAAKRIEETTGLSSKTIHRLLEVDGVTKGFKKNIDNPLDCGLVVVDEVSMVDLRLYSSFISSIQKGTTKVVIVGDQDQLPSVGPGNVLHDLLQAQNYIPSTKLKTIYRQKETSNIVKNAHAINNFKPGETTLTSSQDDFQFIYIDDDMPEEEIFNFILNRFKEESKIFKDVQVLTPARKETKRISSTNLNPYLSQIANKENQNGPSWKKGEKTVFHINDKVMQLRNNYKKEVFNGETGRIKSIKDGVITIKFQEKEADYISAEEFDLSYAISVHKSQGSEFDCVILPILKSDIYMLNKPLIYTGITRAKKKVVLIAHQKTLCRIISKPGEMRKTNMTGDLQIYHNTGKLPNFVHFTPEDIKKFAKIDLFQETEDFA